MNAPASPESPADLRPRTLALVATCLAATFVLFPAITVFLGNVLEFPFSLAQASTRLLALTAGAAAALFLVLGRSHGTGRARLVALALGLACAGWIQAHLLSWDYGLLDGTAIPWHRYFGRGLVDLGLWLTVSGLFIWRWRTIHACAARLALGLLLVQLASALLAAAHAEPQPSYLRVGLDPAKRFRLSADRNVIVIILDGAQSSEFARVLEDEPALRRAFDGFTWFRDAIADFPITQTSIPALLTAQRYDNSLPYASFVQQAYLGRSSLPRVLRRAGFLVDLYALRRAVLLDERVASNLVPRGGLAGPFAELLDVAAFRVAPQPLKRLLYADQRWCARRIVRALGLDRQPASAIAAEIADNVEFCEAFRRQAGSELESRPLLKLFHLNGPHLPLSVNERGEREALPYSPANYRRALTGVTRLMASLLDTLRQRGLFDRSLLLIVSDHGHYAPVVLPRDRPLPMGESPAEFPRALALLLVKPLGSSGPLRVSDAPVQLSDVPQTVLGGLGLGTAGVDGEDVFTLSADSRRRRTFRAMRDAHWRLSRRLDVMTEYSVSGFSWLRSSWSPTGRVLGSYGEALRVFRDLQRDAFLGRPTAETNRGTLPGMLVTNEDELIVFFPTPEPAQGDHASVSLPLERLQPGHRYRLALDVVDRCPLVHPGWFEQSLWLDDRLLDVHDLGGDDFVGARRIRDEFVATSRCARLRAVLRVVGRVEAGGPWATDVRIGLRRLRMQALDARDGERGTEE